VLGNAHSVTNASASDRLSWCGIIRKLIDDRLLHVDSLHVASCTSLLLRRYLLFFVLYISMSRSYSFVLIDDDSSTLRAKASKNE